MENGKHVRNSVIIVSNEDRIQKNKNERDPFDEEKVIDAQMRADLNKF